MTTEVLRNMLYADSSGAAGPALRRDGRGALPRRPLPRCGVGGDHHPPAAGRAARSRSSATVSNAEEFGDWLDTVRGDTEVIVSEIRPVPLEQHVLVRGDLLPLFDDRAGIATAQVNQELMRIRSFKGSNFENNRRVQSMRSARQDGGLRGVRVADRTRAASGRCARRTCSASSGSTGPRSSSCSQRANLLPGDLLHLQPRRVRRRGAAGASLRRPADHAGGARRDPRDRRGAHPHPARRGPRRARLLGVARQPRARRRRRTTPGCCRRSRRSSRSSSSASS